MKINKVHIIFLLLFAFISASLFAQSYTISGTIMDVNKTSVEGATIIIYDANNNITNYTISDQFGKYTVESDSLTKNVIEASHVAFYKHSKRIDQITKTSENLNVDFVLNENTNSLKEVVILSANKEKDTVKLDLKKLELYDDSSLKDILERIPNFRLGDNGSIIYKGKSINKILVNKNETFVSQNNIALESIENKLIENISIINNYSDSFSLDFEEIEETVLNIDTKQINQNILSGTSSLKYGFENKYEIKNKGFLFSQSLNAFVTSNINNIGNKIINYKEMNQLFDQDLIPSPYQRRSLSLIFDQDENLEKDFFTTNNVTLRRKGNRTKISSVMYFIAPSRVESLTNTSTTLDNQSILKQSVREMLNAKAFLGNTKIAFKLTDRTILSYNINGNWMSLKNKSFINNQLFQTGQPDGTNEIISKSLINTYAISNKVSLASKIRKNLILESLLKSYNERSDLFDNYRVDAVENFQDFFYEKDLNKIESNLKYKFSTWLIPKFNIKYQKTTEKIKDRGSSATLASRVIPNFVAKVNLVGQDILKQIDYDFSFSLDYAENTISDLKNNSLFFPLDLSVDYENKLNRIALSFSRKRSFADLRSRLNRIESFNKNVSGNENFPLLYNKSEQIGGNYSYNDVFNGTSFSLECDYFEYSNTLKNNFIQIDQGISFLGTFIAEKSKEFKLSANYSKALFQMSYPIIVDLDITYKNELYPNLIDRKFVEVDKRITSPGVKFQTNTKNLFNFRLSSEFSFINYVTSINIFKATYRTNSLSILLKNEKWNGNLTFLYDNNTIDDVEYLRKNININLSHTQGKFVFSIDGRHLGELLSIIDNNAYNSQINITNGINSLTLNNQSLNYLLFGITYKL